jgi:hypothetical protein
MNLNPELINKSEYQSILDFRNESKRIIELISFLHVVILVFNKTIVNGNSKKYNEMLKKYPFLEYKGEKIDNIYELGFIRLFASFEAFMYEFIKELYSNHPKSLPTDKKIQISDVLRWDIGGSLHDFIIDHIAVENSYDLPTWEKNLKNTFGIDIYEDEEEKKAMEVLNMCRNMLIHSGGKINSKMARDYIKIFSKDMDPSEVFNFKVEKWDIFDIKMFMSLLNVTMRIIDRLEKNN